MSRKAFHIGIDLNIHAVSCPGVWLCPKGDVMLRISMLGATEHTKRVEPSFPLLFHESFHFRKTVIGITSLAGLQTELTKCLVHIQLVQWQVHDCRSVLQAVFRCPLSELLYPQPASRGLLAGVDINLLMETTPCFPGIIAPKVEVSTKVVIEEIVNYSNRDALIINHKTLTSKKTGHKKEEKSADKSKTKSTLSSGYRYRRRQKPVCHTRPSVKCYNCKQKVDWPQRLRGGGDEQCGCMRDQPVSRKDILYLPYCKKCGDVVEENAIKKGKILINEGSQHTGKWENACSCAERQHFSSGCDCNHCRRYISFKDFDTSLMDSTLSQNSKSSNRRFSSIPSPTQIDKCCPCLADKSVDGLPRDRASDQIRKAPTKHEEYHIFKADLDTHYKKLYERVSRRNN